MLINILLALQLGLLLATIVLILFVFCILSSFINMVPLVPTPRRVVKRMIELAGLKEGDKACDLGSGLGKIIFAAVRVPGVEIIGVEKHPLIYWLSKFFALFHRTGGRLQIVRADMLDYDLSSFDVVFCYLIPEAMEKLKPNFEKMKVGSKIISLTFSLRGSNCFQERIIMVGKKKIFVYNKVR